MNPFILILLSMGSLFVFPTLLSHAVLILYVGYPHQSYLHCNARVVVPFNFFFRRIHFHLRNVINTGLEKVENLAYWYRLAD